jgi:bacterioferritin
MKGLSDLGTTFTGVSQGLVTSMQQLRIHRAMSLHWGYEALGARLKAVHQEKEKALDALLLSLLAAETTPDLQTLGRLNVGQTVEEILQSERRMAFDVKELALTVKSELPPGESLAHGALEGIVACSTRHVAQFDQSLELIRQMGIQNYLATRC